MTPPNDNFTFLDKGVLSALLKKMDKDIATRVALSAVSLDPKKINDALSLAFQEMAIRAKEKKKQEKAGEVTNRTKLNSKEQAKDLVDAIEALLKGGPTSQGEGEFELEFLVSPEEDEEDKG